MISKDRCYLDYITLSQFMLLVNGSYGWVVLGHTSPSLFKNESQSWKKLKTCKLHMNLFFGDLCVFYCFLDFSCFICFICFICFLFVILLFIFINFYLFYFFYFFYFFCVLVFVLFLCVISLFHLFLFVLFVLLCCLFVWFLLFLFIYLLIYRFYLFYLLIDSFDLILEYSPVCSSIIKGGWSRCGLTSIPDYSLV